MAQYDLELQLTIVILQICANDKKTRHYDLTHDLLLGMTLDSLNSTS